ncbi:tRNA (5-methylaminomethyl-2-thiouridine)(34)-methyltransferase MnmD [Leadbetterella sp. DM7]|uniref:tRNA (5-methylaminomethyl-2-thiouridine)(34)-methyltransferase MnmD n=1 Tax=Leadbetterella sp. DM7 TaxID=3235085 RepID=UPI00349E877F
MGIRETSDGSVTFYSEKYGQTYHSIHGARTESERVFIELGLTYAATVFHELNILEVGFGTGLNAWLTQQKVARGQIPVNYTGIEAYPLAPSDYQMLPPELCTLQELPWEVPHTISPGFNVIKKKARLEDFHSDTLFHLVYFDAFSPDAQPELWSADIFVRIGNMMCNGGVITTYCSKSSVQKNLRSAGFTVEKHPGPPHKREVLRAIKK